VGSTPPPPRPRAKFSLVRGDSQISFIKGVYPGVLVYRQYCPLPAPYKLIKIHFYFTGAMRFNHYIYIYLSLDTTRKSRARSRSKMPTNMASTFQKFIYHNSCVNLLWFLKKYRPNTRSYHSVADLKEKSTRYVCRSFKQRN